MAFTYTFDRVQTYDESIDGFIYVGQCYAIKINTPLTKIRKRICRSGFERLEIANTATISSPRSKIAIDPDCDQVVIYVVSRIDERQSYVTYGPSSSFT